MWKVEEGSQLVCRAKPRTVSLDSVAMVDPKTYFSGSENGSLCLWSVAKKKPTYVRNNAHGGKWITSVASLPSTDLAATGSSDGALQLWQIDTQEKWFDEVAHLSVPGFVNGIQFGPSGRVVVAAVGREHRLGRWEKMKASEARNGLQVVRLPDFGLRAAGVTGAAVAPAPEPSARDRILPSYE